MAAGAIWIVAALGAALSVAGVLLWLRHRRHLIEVERRLAWSEASRFELEHQVQATGAQLHAMSQTVLTQQQALESARELVERRAALEQVLEPAADSQPAAHEWADTMPFGVSGNAYVKTVPGELAVAAAASRAS